MIAVDWSTYQSTAEARGYTTTATERIMIVGDVSQFISLALGLFNQYAGQGLTILGL
jgi:hypothetical protein